MNIRAQHRETEKQCPHIVLMWSVTQMNLFIVDL
jgi:hypothetical protein